MDFLPRKRSENKGWWQNLNAKLDEEAPKFGLPPAEVTAAKALASSALALLNATDDAESALAAARVSEKNGMPDIEQNVRAAIRHWKTLPLFPASGSEGALKLKGAASGFDPETHNLKVKLSLEGPKIRVDFTKGGFDAVAVYCRLRGSAGWTRLGTDAFSPYYDTNPLANPATPETREYQLRGMIDDEEVGPASDIVSIVFGG